MTTGGQPDSIHWRAMSDLAATGRGAAEDIADQIQGFVISIGMPAGTRLPSERHLAEMLSTSRPTVSQAIRILVVRGLIESRRGSGAYVTLEPGKSLAATVTLMLALDEDSAPQLNDMRLWLETIGVTEAIDTATSEEMRNGRTALERLEGSVGDTAAWMSADTAFHATLVRASHNPFLSSIYEGVHASLLAYEFRSWIDCGEVPGWLAASEAGAVTALHEPILRAIVDRDERAARDAVLSHHQAMSDHLAGSAV